jgi:hypothetical protein
VSYGINDVLTHAPKSDLKMAQRSELVFKTCVTFPVSFSLRQTTQFAYKQEQRTLPLIPYCICLKIYTSVSRLDMRKVRSPISELTYQIQGLDNCASLKSI